jgi:hypothetical protein
MKKKKSLQLKYPPSGSCDCEICRHYCSRPGWWTVEQTERAIDAGFAKRMMIEMSPELDFAVISPAFKGCEGGMALNLYSNNGCNFYKDEKCELYPTGFVPLECRFCHHERTGMGKKCHSDIEKDWNSEKGQRLVARWIRLVGLGKI